VAALEDGVAAALAVADGAAAALEAVGARFDCGLKAARGRGGGGRGLGVSCEPPTLVSAIL
jgi:hypothetical protein